jgi:hypothetical protein
MSAIAQIAHCSAGGVLKAQENYFNNYDTRPFALVSQNLAQLGSIPLEQFLSAKTDYPDRRDGHISATQETTRNSGRVSLSPDIGESDPAAKVHAIVRLYQACGRAFGRSEALTFEFLEEGGPQSRSCYLGTPDPRRDSIFSFREAVHSHYHASKRFNQIIQHKAYVLSQKRSQGSRLCHCDRARSDRLYIERQSRSFEKSRRASSCSHQRPRTIRLRCGNGTR